MSNSESFRQQPQRQPPTPFETLAAFSRFQNVREGSPEFYLKHHDAIDNTVGFIRFLASQNKHFAQIFTLSITPVSTVAGVLEQAMREMDLEQKTVDFIDSGMTGIMHKLHRVVTDPDLPPYLQDCVWPIVGAFEP